MTANETIFEPVIFKTLRFDMLAVGSEFRSKHVGPSIYIKTSSRKARIVRIEPGDEALSTEQPEFAVKPSTCVEIPDITAMDARAREEAKPLFDGTEASCKTQADFHALDAARHDVVTAAEKIDEMADYLSRKMDDIKHSLRANGCVEAEQKHRWSPKFTIAPAAIVEYHGLNSLGEVQGNGNIDMLIATYVAKREAFKHLVSALGYRVS